MMIHQENNNKEFFDQEVLIVTIKFLSNILLPLIPLTNF